jgi:hypothetical protein
MGTIAAMRARVTPPARITGKTAKRGLTGA